MQTWQHQHSLHLLPIAGVSNVKWPGPLQRNINSYDPLVCFWQGWNLTSEFWPIFKLLIMHIFQPASMTECIRENPDPVLPWNQELNEFNLDVPIISNTCTGTETAEKLREQTHLKQICPSIKTPPGQRLLSPSQWLETERGREWRGGQFSFCPEGSVSCLNISPSLSGLMWMTHIHLGATTPLGPHWFWPTLEWLWRQLNSNLLNYRRCW